MKSRTSRSGKRSQKPARRVSALKKKRSGSSARSLLLRGWWILRGVFAGVFALGAIYGVYLGFGAVAQIDALSVKKIEIEGCREVQAEKVMQMTGIMSGDPLLKLDLGEIRRRVVAHPFIKDATVVRQLPGTLRISVKERVPVAVVLGQGFALVDAEANVLDVRPTYPADYPVITGLAEPVQAGWSVDQARPALEVLGHVTRSGLIGSERISELRIEGDSVRVSLMDSGTVLVLGTGRAAEHEMGKLARLMEAGLFDERAPGYDFRFEGRVIGLPDSRSEASGASFHAPAGG